MPQGGNLSQSSRIHSIRFTRSSVEIFNAKKHTAHSRDLRDYGLGFFIADRCACQRANFIQPGYGQHPRLTSG